MKTGHELLGSTNCPILRTSVVYSYLMFVHFGVLLNEIKFEEHVIKAYLEYVL